MDQKTWLWRKRGSAEKTINITTADEVQQSGPSEKELALIQKEEELENSLKELSEKLDSVMEECSAKDELLQNYEETAKNAVSEKERSEEEMQRLRRELDEALEQKGAANERLGHLNSALKDSMQQLSLVRKEQDQRIHEAVTKATEETTKKLASWTVESSYLDKAIAVKDRMINELTSSKGQTEAEFEALMSRLDKVEKENAFLRYEVRTFEKELDLRNEELEYGRRSAEAAQKQHLESVKKIKKLEAECQRLRALTRKRLPNSATFANMRSNLEITEQKNRTDFRRRKDVSGNSVDRNSSVERSFLIDHVRDLEKENEILKECLVMKEEQILCLKKVEDSASETHLSNTAPDELLLTSGCGIGDSNEIVCSRSWASDMSLMDDFAEMEKLAIVAVENHTSPDSLKENKARSMTKDLVPVKQKGVDLLCSGKPDDWLSNVASVILEQHGISKRSFDELLGDVRMVLNSLTCPDTTDSLPISGYITWKSPTSPPKSSLVEQHSMVRDAFKKHLGGEGPGTALELEAVQKLMSEMENICSIFQLEINNLKSELGTIKSSAKDVDESLRSVKEDNEVLRNELQQSRESVESLQKEMEILKDSKQVAEEQVENQKQMNEDLDTQLNVTTVKLNETLQKLSSLEVQLDDRSHCCNELEGTCLDLQLQLESIRNIRYSEGNEKQELLQTGMDITKASVRLEECEQTILKLGRQLKALGSTKELAVVEKVLSMTELTEPNNKKLSKRLSLHDMLSEDGAEAEAISTTETNATTRSYPGEKNQSRSFKGGALVIVPSKQRGGMSFLKKLLLRKKKTGTKNATFYYSK